MMCHFIISVHENVHNLNRCIGGFYMHTCPIQCQAMEHAKPVYTHDHNTQWSDRLTNNQFTCTASKYGQNIIIISCCMNLLLS